MSTFDVTENPIQVYMGEQPQVTLVNDGPYTIYFDSIPGVDTLNGFELPPTGQMTWKSNQPLWARTRTIPSQETRARLKTNIAGELSLTTRAKFFRQLRDPLQITNTGWGTAKLETGHCNSLLLSRTAPNLQGAEFETLQILWYDENLNIIDSDKWSSTIVGAVVSGSWYTAQMNQGPGCKFAIPVKGKYCSISGSGLTAIPGSMTFIGSDVIVPNKVDGGFAVSATATPAVATTYDGRTAFVGGWNGTGAIYLPSLGPLLTVYVANTGAFQYMELRDSNSRGVGLLSVTAGFSTRFEFDVTINAAYHLVALGPFAGNVSCQWPTSVASN